ncbi:hypothetical protein IYO1511_c11180 [Lactiplantibacillus plantarum]|nr:hypothetical protein IYO1511_c11180 [Lactiplantibacillus plantarum]
MYKITPIAAIRPKIIASGFINPVLNPDSTISQIPINALIKLIPANKLGSLFAFSAVNTSRINGLVD